MKFDVCYVVHAYSASNSGDGLLVDLTLKNISKEVLNLPTYLVCIDPASFEYLKDVYPSLTIVSLQKFVSTAIFNRNKKSLVIGVGGGYLRSGTFIEGLKSLVAHGSQLFAQKLLKDKCAIYLPQSVGPFKGVGGGLLKWLLTSTVDYLYCRDDKSLAEVKNGKVKALRLPDMVVSEIQRDISSIVFKEPQKVYLVARDLSLKPYSSQYNVAIKALFERIQGCEVVIQASSRGNNDIQYCESVFGIKNPRLLKDALESEPGIVVSVRLHGSLETILSGCQSIHLSYERKGYAAFHDLGLNEFVLHSSDFAISDVIDRVASIRRAPMDYSKSMVSSGAQDSYFDKIKEVISA